MFSLHGTQQAIHLKHLPQRDSPQLRGNLPAGALDLAASTEASFSGVTRQARWPLRLSEQLLKQQPADGMLWSPLQSLL